MSIKLISDITLTLISIFPKTYNIYVISPEEALKAVEALNGQKQQPSPTVPSVSNTNDEHNY
jgi:hypothetical protein